MRNFRIGLIIAAIIVIIVFLAFINYGNLSWSENSTSYGMIIAMIFTIIGMIASNIHDKRKQNKE